MPCTSKRLALVIAFALSAFSIQIASARGDMEPPSDHQPAAPEPATPFYFVDYATTDNGRSVAQVLDRAVDALLESGNLSLGEQYLIADDARYMGNLAPGRIGAVLEQLAGSQNANLGSATQNNMNQISNGLLSAMRELNDSTTRSGPGRLWIQGLGNTGRLDGQRGSAGVKQSTQGLMLGADWAVDPAWRVGAMVGKSDSDLSAKRFKANLDSWHLGAYAVRQDGPLALRLGAIHSNHSGQNKRSIDFDFIDYRERVNGQYKAKSQNAFTELGYRLDSGTFNTEPFIGLGYQRYQRKSFKEKGGMTALNVGAQTQDNLSSTLGVRLASLYTLDNQMTLKPHLSTHWKHLYGDVTSRVRQSSAWVNKTVFNSDFVIDGSSLDRDSLALKAGLDVGVSASQSIGLTYSSEFGTRSSNQSVLGQWTLSF